MSRYTSKTVYLNYDTDADLIEALENYQRAGGNLSDLIRNLLREYFFGPQIEKIDDKAIYRVIQLEKRLNDLIDHHEKFQQSVLEFVNGKVVEFAEEIRKFKEELTNLKQIYEKLRDKKKEEEERKKEEEERKKEEEIRNLIKKKFGWYSECERYGGLTPLQRVQLKKEIKAFAEEQGLTVEEVKRILFSIYPNLREVMSYV